MTSPDSARAAALLEDYKLKAAFLTEAINRVQTQFQVMLTLQAGLATALIVSNTGSLTEGAPWIVLLELALSIAWVMVGWSGRRRLIAHGRTTEKAGRLWAHVAGISDGHEPVGSGVQVQVVGVLAPTALTLGWATLFIVLLVKA